jgi:L-ascorbate metabolism protein UlaG (beta-lactamase superfamily)
MKMIMYLLLLLIGLGIIFTACSPHMGAIERNTPAQDSANFSNGTFHNLVPTSLSTGEKNGIRAALDFLRGKPDRIPPTTLPSVELTVSETVNAEQLDVTWLGHSTCLLQIDGQVILTDPMFSDRASPLAFLGPKKFAYESSIKIQDLPKIDAVLISHDHYDHLDYQTIKELKGKTRFFYVPVGVGDHLRRWGVENHQIIERDWWEQASDGSLIFIATPAQHFSGRGLTDRNKTLWASWVILGSRHRVFFGGDSGYFSGFKTIGDKYGPFDITMLESGAYNEAWPDIHMLPEQTVQAHIDLQGKLLLPIHWAKFNLSLHPWQEPIERLTKQARVKNVHVVTPKIGQSFVAEHNVPDSPWWKPVMN